jgi:hypothetical protein
MLEDPFNDYSCLKKIIEDARAKAETPEIRAIAGRFRTREEVAAWIRTLPQEMDTGDPLDGPKVQCDVPQRLRVPTRKPNCVERAGLYLAICEHLFPEIPRTLATVDTAQGRHTFPIEDGQPVILDPQVPRNALAAGVEAIERAAGRGRRLSFREALIWIVEVAEEPARAYPNGRAHIRNARRAVDSVLDRDARIRQGELEALCWACVLAEREAALWGPYRVATVGRTVHELDRRVRRRCLRNRVRVEVLPAAEIARSVGRVATRVGAPLLSVAVKAKLASLGIPPSTVDMVESELAREARRVRERRQRPEGGRTQVRRFQPSERGREVVRDHRDRTKPRRRPADGEE